MRDTRSSLTSERSDNYVEEQYATNKVEVWSHFTCRNKRSTEAMRQKNGIYSNVDVLKFPVNKL